MCRRSNLQPFTNLDSTTHTGRCHGKLTTRAMDSGLAIVNPRAFSSTPADFSSALFGWNGWQQVRLVFDEASFLLLSDGLLCAAKGAEHARHDLNCRPDIPEDSRILWKLIGNTIAERL